MKMMACALRGRGGTSGEKDSWHLRLELGEEDISNTITSVQKDYLLIEIYPIKKQRNEYGKLIRKDYEAHRLPDVRRKDIKRYEPMGDGVCRTVTTFVEDNLMLEIYEDGSKKR